MKDYKKLIVWQKGHDNAKLVYDLTKHFPKEERYGITSQIRRAVVSVPTNIAEGCGKFTQRDFARYLQIAFGSANEVEYHLLLATDLEVLDGAAYSHLESKLIEVKRMLAS